MFDHRLARVMNQEQVEAAAGRRQRRDSASNGGGRAWNRASLARAVSLVAAGGMLLGVFASYLSALL